MKIIKVPCLKQGKIWGIFEPLARKNKNGTFRYLKNNAFKNSKKKVYVESVIFFWESFLKKVNNTGETLIMNLKDFAIALY